MSMTLSEEVRGHRQKVLDYLRRNPDERHQIEAVLADDKGGRCVLGMACDAMGIPIDGTDGSAEVNNVAYQLVEERLKWPVNLIWRLNDSLHLTFSQAADRLEREWNEQDPEDSPQDDQVDVPLP